MLFAFCLNQSAKLKAQSRLAEVEGTVQNMNRKAMAIEKDKMQLQAKIDELALQMDDAQSNFVQIEKRAKNFDKIVIEWKSKIDGLQAELDQTQCECRSYSTELFKVKTTYDESAAAGWS
jgi:chromosome segregation ATPase